MTEIIAINRDAPEKIFLDHAARIIQGGGVVAFPTETFYGLGVSAFDERAIRKVFEIKERNPLKPLLILINDESSLSGLVKEIPDLAVPLIETFWPGPLTLIFNALPKFPSIITGNTGRIGIRKSSNVVARKLVEEAGIPITATSANREGRESPSLAAQVALQLGNKIDLIIDAGKTEGRIGSTIVDVTRNPPRIVREGEIKRAEIESRCALKSINHA